MTTKKAFLLFTVCIAVLYLPFLNNAFVSDDIQGLVEQAPTWNLVSATGWPQYIHLSVFGQFMTYHAFGLQPWAFRLVNILFHLGSVLLVYCIGKRLVKPAAALAGALVFAVHPLAIESVTWIAGGVYSQYTFWFLLAFFLYLKGRRWYPWSVLSFAVSVCTSEKALSLALLFPLYEWFYGTIKKRWEKSIPFFLLSIGLILFYVTRIGYRIAAVNQGSSMSSVGLTNPFLQIPVAISTYVQLFVMPMGLTLYHSELMFPWWNFAIRVGATLIGMGIGITALVKRKSWGFWVWWICICLAPTLTPLKIGWIVAERYVYCALVGFSIGIGICFDILLHRKNWFVPTLCVGISAILFFCAQTVSRNSQWRTEDTLWMATAKTSPSHPPTWNNMGDVYARHGDLIQATAMFERAISLNPNYAEAYHNLGNTWLRMGKLTEAKAAYTHALSINPNLWQSYRDLAVIYYEEGDVEKATTLLTQALHIAPADTTLLQLQSVLH